MLGLDTPLLLERCLLMAQVYQVKKKYNPKTQANELTIANWDVSHSTRLLCGTRVCTPHRPSSATS